MNKPSAERSASPIPSRLCRGIFVVILYVFYVKELWMIVAEDVRAKTVMTEGFEKLAKRS